MGQPAEKLDENILAQDGIKENDNNSDQEQEAQISNVDSGPESILKNYLRLMTWEELIEIASVFDATSMIPLTEYLTKEVLGKNDNKSSAAAGELAKVDEKSAKILPFSKVGEIVEQDASCDDYCFDKYDEAIEEAKNKSVIEVNKNGSFSIYDEQEELERKRKELKKVNLGEFILRQKNKLKQCQKKLKKKEIYLLYKNHSSVDIRSNKSEDEKQQGIKVSSNSGVLINKRQK